jgi:hypothetical protein
MIDTTKIFAGPVELYVKPRTNAAVEEAHTSDDGWLGLGAAEEKTTKVKTTTATKKIQTGQSVELLKTLEWESKQVESDQARITAVEALKNKTCDLILKTFGSERHWKIAGTSVMIDVDATFSGDEFLGLPIKGTVIGGTLGDVFREITLDWGGEGGGGGE